MKTLLLGLLIASISASVGCAGGSFSNCNPADGGIFNNSAMCNYEGRRHALRRSRDDLRAQADDAARIHTQRKRDVWEREQRVAALQYQIAGLDQEITSLLGELESADSLLTESSTKRDEIARKAQEIGSKMISVGQSVHERESLGDFPPVLPAEQPTAADWLIAIGKQLSFEVADRLAARAPMPGNWKVLLRTGLRAIEIIADVYGPTLLPTGSSPSVTP